MFRKKCLAALGALALLIPAQAMALQCAPFARQISGVEIFGNAKTWWYQAEGRYARGDEPKLGAVMTFKPTRSMPMGHVAMVSKIVSDREVLIDHSNWSTIDGRRGHVERGARVIDVSTNGDWSEVRVWYAPVKGLGTSSYPLYGFIYNDADKSAEI
ncbi:MAG: CHAP domain-containing protein [Sphingobium sp.]|nr:MAG: CHAP domain-containing protein [Sphingobium sp.]